MRQILIMIFFSYLTSCTYDYSYTRGYIMLQGTEGGDVICLTREDTTFERYLVNDSMIMQKGTAIQYHYKDRIDTALIWGEDISIIKSHINECKIDSFFMVIDQKPFDSIFGIPIFNPDYHRPHRPPHAGEAFEKLHKSNIHDYWIINKRTDDIYFLPTFEEYISMKNELGISDSLRLSCE